MSIETPQQLRALRAVGRVVADAIRAMRIETRPGVTTGEFDDIGARVFARAGARSGPQLDYGFPGVNCISVNDEAVHGIPGKRRLRDGDLVKLDVTAELDGFYADACVSVPVGKRAVLHNAWLRSPPSTRQRVRDRRSRCSTQPNRSHRPLNRHPTRLRGMSRPHRTRDRTSHSRRAQRPQLLPPPLRSAAYRGLGHHDRTDHRRWHGRGPRRWRRMDAQDPRRVIRRPLRAHHRRYQRQTNHPHRLAAARACLVHHRRRPPESVAHPAQGRELADPEERPGAK